MASFAQPLAITWKGAGAWLIFSQSRQVNFSRTVSITFHWRGGRFQGLGHVFAQLAQAVSATAVARGRRLNDHPLARKVFRKGIPFGALAFEPRHRGDLGDGDLGGQLIFGGTCFQFLELERQLIDEKGRPLRARAVELTLQLGDPQLLVRDHGQVGRRFGSGDGEFSGSDVTLRSDFPHLGALDRQRGFQRVDIVRKVGKGGVHDPDRIMNSGSMVLLYADFSAFFGYPAD